MAESVSIREYNGIAPGTPTALTSITGRYCSRPQIHEGVQANEDV